MRLSVIKICGLDCISRNAGEKFRNEIIKNWSHDKIEIIIGKTPIGSVSFFDEAIALLIKREKKPISEIRRKLVFPDITEEDRKLLNYVMMAQLTEQKLKK